MVLRVVSREVGLRGMRRGGKKSEVSGKGMGMGWWRMGLVARHVRFRSCDGGRAWL